MELIGIQKLTLLDYPEKLACTVFLKGCNFKCPFCHNAPWLEDQSVVAGISEKAFFEFLETRGEKLEGVCVSGGEPTINPDLPDFLERIKDMGFDVKLDTNGSNPKMLEKVLYDGLVDYIAMDIKTDLVADKYKKLAGVEVDVNALGRSIDDVMTDRLIEYEFRTTVIDGVHTVSDFEEIAKFISGADKYVLQAYKPYPYIKEESFRTPSLEFLHECRNALKEGVYRVDIKP